MKRKLNQWLWLVGFFSLVLVSCDEIISQDISDSSLTLYGPQDSLYTSNDIVAFFWELDNEVENYELQVVTPDFNNPLLVFDTSLSGANSINVQFEPDYAYTWRIRGKNEGSASDWQQRTFIIDQTAPNRATALTLDNVVVPNGTIPNMEWLSSDALIQDINRSFPVEDSIFLSFVNDSTRFYGFYREEGEARSVSAQQPNGVALASGKYYWFVRTIDRAGQKNTSELFRFEVQ